MKKFQRTALAIAQKLAPGIRVKIVRGTKHKKLVFQRGKQSKWVLIPNRRCCDDTGFIRSQIRKVVRDLAPKRTARKNEISNDTT